MAGGNAADVVDEASTFLFVPGTRDDRFQNAVNSGTDIVIIDLEDAVATEDKAIARANVSAWLATGSRVAVRVNGVDTPWFADDLAAAERAIAIVVPKIQSHMDIARVQSHAPRPRMLIPLVETPGGVLAAEQICTAPGVVRVGFGNVDFAAEVGVAPTSHLALAAARSQLVYASAAAGIAPPIDGVTTAVSDNEALLRDTLHARELGFTGKLLIHPSQVDVVTAKMRPSEEELTWARAVLESVHVGVDVHNGEMIDEPVLARARRLLQRARRHGPTGAGWDIINS